MALNVIVVTGASRGIGLAVAQSLLQEQSNTRLVAVARGKEALDDLTARAPEGRVATIAADLSDEVSSKKVVDLALSRFGRIDGLVLNHGTLGSVERVSEAELAAWRKAFDTNVFAAVSLIRNALPHLRISQGRIVLVSSGAAVRGYAAWGCYGMTKAALNHLALTLANEERDITTISIRPGMVDTQMQVDLRTIHTSVMDPDEAVKFSDAKSAGKLLRPDQPGNVIARLAVAAPRDLSGFFLSWDDKDKLAQFQGP